MIDHSETPNESEVLVRLTSLDIETAKQKLIAKALEMSHGNRTRAAVLLGMSVRTLRNRLNTPCHTSCPPLHGTHAPSYHEIASDSTLAKL